MGNRRLLEALANLTLDEFTRELGASFGSVRGTVIHIMWGEKRWLHRWLAGSRLPDPLLSDFPDLASVAAAWSRVEAERDSFVRHLTNERLEAAMTVHGQQYTLAGLMQHILNHSTYHRGQVVLLLRQLGHQPPATDYAVFLSETRETPA